MSAAGSALIRRPLPDVVTYDLSTPHRVTITLPPGSRWSSGLHWHETHVEFLRVVRGRARVRLGAAAAARIVTAADGEVRVDPYVWHEWARESGGESEDADADADAEDLVVEERTEPADGDKALFWNLNGVVLKAAQVRQRGRPPKWLWAIGLQIWVALSLFVIFKRLDNVPVLLNARKRLGQCGIRLAPVDGSLSGQVLFLIDWAASHLVLALAAVAGWMLCLRAVRREFKPEQEYREWVARSDEKAKDR